MTDVAVTTGTPGVTPPISDLTPPTTPAAVEERSPAEQAAKTIDEDLRGVWDRLHKPRDTATGKFTKADGATTPKDEKTGELPLAAEGAADNELPADQTAETGTEQAKAKPAETAIDGPLSWSAEMKARVASLPPEFADVVKYAAQRDKENHEAISRAGQQLKAYEPVKNFIEPLRAISAEHGNIGEGEVLKNLINAHAFLRDDPKAAIKWLADNHGVDLKGFANEQTQDGSPDVTALRAELAEERQRVARIESHLTAQQRAQLEGQNAELTRQIADFSKDKPHFETVKPIMAGLLTSGAAETLQDAYDKAIYAEPTVRTSILADQQKANEVKRKEEEAKRVSAAKKVASVNVKSSTSAGQNPRTIDEDLEEIARKAYGT